jgi:Kef-type K+ transport system membrane component KefB
VRVIGNPAHAEDGRVGLSDHQLLMFLLDLVVLIVVARLGGELAARVGIPLHVGELLLGICLGPSLLGALWPAGFEELFPRDPLVRATLDVVNWLGVIFLVTVAGLETNLGVLRRAGRAVVGGWIGGFFLPFFGGFGLGMLVPGVLIPSTVPRPLFALFLATAMSISAIPVIARVLMDLNLFHTRVGMVIISSALADDTVGWIVLALVAGLAAGMGAFTAPVVVALVGTVIYLGLMLAFGPRLIRASIRFARRLRIPHAETAMVLTLVLTGGVITQAIGVHLVLGCFVTSILIGQVPDRNPETNRAIRHIGMGVLVPFFFAYTGIKVDLTTLSGSTFWVMVAAVLVACAGKIIGGSIGAAAGGMPKWEALSVGVGLNARGAMELVIAAVGLSIGILNEATYAIIVLIAILTTVMAAPVLKFTMARAGAEAGEPGELEAAGMKPELVPGHE